MNVPIQRRVHLLRGTKPTEMQAREVLLRQLSRGDKEKSDLIRTLPPTPIFLGLCSSFLSESEAEIAE